MPHSTHLQSFSAATAFGSFSAAAATARLSARLASRLPQPLLCRCRTWRAASFSSVSALGLPHSPFSLCRSRTSFSSHLLLAHDSAQLLLRRCEIFLSLLHSTRTTTLSAVSGISSLHLVPCQCFVAAATDSHTRLTSPPLRSLWPFQISFLAQSNRCFAGSSHFLFCRYHIRLAQPPSLPLVRSGGRMPHFLLRRWDSQVVAWIAFSLLSISITTIMIVLVFNFSLAHSLWIRKSAASTDRNSKQWLHIVIVAV